MKNVFSNIDPVLVLCESNYSFFFDFVAKEMAGPKTAPLHRVCSLMRKMKVKCFVREELEENSEIKEELAAVALRADRKVQAKAIRYTFFRTAPANGSWKALEDTDVLGYVVVLKLEPELPVPAVNPQTTIYAYILEAVIVPPHVVLEGGAVERVTNYYVHSCRQYETTVGKTADNKTFRLTGTFFCQQNGFTNACAHAALRMAMNSWPAYRGQKVTFEAINKILNVDHSRFRNVLNDGLDAKHIADVIRALGHEPDVAEFWLRPDISYEEYIYPHIESGCPVILGLANARFGHVVAVVGHTLNSDRWAEARHMYGAVPQASYLSAAGWADHFIVNDDNFGMYVTLPTEAIKNIIVPKYNPNLFASVGVGVLPGKPVTLGPNAEVSIAGYNAEQLASMFLHKLLRETTPAPDNRWFNLLKGGSQALVCRTVFRVKADYVKSLAEMCDERGNKISGGDVQFVERLLPESVWVTEIMTPNLYAGNKRKLGEILSKTRATEADIRDRKTLVFGWLAGVRWHGSGLKSGPKDWPILGHVALARGIPAEKCKLEW
jgi:hypothetical protein